MFIRFHVQQLVLATYQHLVPCPAQAMASWGCYIPEVIVSSGTLPRMVHCYELQVIKKVKEHHKKKRRELKKSGKKPKEPKDPGIPSQWPFKEELLKEMAWKRQQILMQEKAKKEERKRAREVRHQTSELVKSIFKCLMWQRRPGDAAALLICPCTVP